MKQLLTFEEKSYFKLVPSKNIKETISELKANEIFENYNREREYMSRSRSKSSGSHRASMYHKDQ